MLISVLLGSSQVFQLFFETMGMGDHSAITNIIIQKVNLNTSARIESRASECVSSLYVYQTSSHTCYFKYPLSLCRRACIALTDCTCN